MDNGLTECPTCNATNQQDATFCSKCGLQLSGHPPANLQSLQVATVWNVIRRYFNRPIVSLLTLILMAIATFYFARFVSRPPFIGTWTIPGNGSGQVFQITFEDNGGLSTSDCRVDSDGFQYKAGEIRGTWSGGSGELHFHSELTVGTSKAPTDFNYRLDATGNTLSLDPINQDGSGGTPITVVRSEPIRAVVQDKAELCGTWQHTVVGLMRMKFNADGTGVYWFVGGTFEGKGAAFAWTEKDGIIKTGDDSYRWYVKLAGTTRQLHLKDVGDTRNTLSLWAGIHKEVSSSETAPIELENARSRLKTQ